MQDLFGLCSLVNRAVGNTRVYCSNVSGSIAVMFAVALPMLLGAAALATDLGVLFLQRRTLQTASDASALAAAWKPETAEASVRALLDAHGMKGATFAISFGTYDETQPDRDKRFTPGAPNNGVRVDTTLKANVYFARIFSMQTQDMVVRSEAAMAPIVSLSAGSRLAAVGPSPVNNLLGSLLGLNLNLSVADYTGLVATKLKLGPLLNAILNEGPVRDLTNVLAKDVLSQPIKLSLLLSLMAKQVDANGDLLAGSVLRKAAQQTLSADLMVVLGDIVQLGDGIGGLNVAYPGAALQTEISALGLLNAAIKQDGIGTSIKTGLNIPNVLEAGVDMLVGEEGKSARSLSISDDLPFIRTDQVRLRLKVKTSVLDGLGVGVNIPIEIIAAGGTARVMSVTCDSDPLKREVKVEVRPGVLRLSIGKFVGALKDANVNDKLEAEVLVKLILAGITGQANIAIKQTQPIYLVFKGKEIGNGISKTAKTTTVVESLLKTLLLETELDVQLLGANLNLGGVLKLVGGLLSGLARVLDGLVNSVLSLVGVSLGEMDVRVDGLTCGIPKIVG